MTKNLDYIFSRSGRDRKKKLKNEKKIEKFIFDHRDFSSHVSGAVFYADSEYINLSS
jgi:hypothetical protein